MASTQIPVQISIDPRFTRLLVRQNELQTFLYPEGVAGMAQDDLAAYIRVQALALIVEATEALDETHWKTWATRPADQDVIPNRKRFESELGDIFLFLMNLMLAGGVTMGDLASIVNAKQDKNMTRWTSGYDGKSEKCPVCKGAYDDVAVECHGETRDRFPYCAQNNLVLRNGQWKP
jgi:NTP pyrophosphatase (non-canonical NTP hydrolase)